MGKTDPTRKTALERRIQSIQDKADKIIFRKTKQVKEKKKKSPWESEIVLPMGTGWLVEGRYIYSGRQTGRDRLRQLIEAEGKIPTIKKINKWQIEYGTGKLSKAVNHINKTYGTKIDINTSTGMDGVELHLYDIGVMHISGSELAIYTIEDMVKRIVGAFDLVKTGATIQSEPNKTESWTDKWLKENTSQK